MQMLNLSIVYDEVHMCDANIVQPPAEEKDYIQ